MPLNPITERRDFLRAARQGQKAARPTVVVQAVPNRLSAAPVRVGVTATKKLGGAVVRNRVKRRLREAARAVLSERGEAGTDYVLIGRKDTAACDYGRLVRDLRAAVEQLAGRAPERRPRHGSHPRR
ncbi:ribonuclease P protein component [Rhodothalassium salexigens]|uniref:ribonuclease P protein component n=1 Tax=Rhodothalassium salexigens TaxID=1086 RepID=UPI0019123290|nr:ribonuclease P protein component [Rhodothalassium salexigens]MBK5910000.1 ribonuclease P protein component [Rhodothalassium salexigens]